MNDSKRHHSGDNNAFCTYCHYSGAPLLSSKKGKAISVPLSPKEVRKHTKQLQSGKPDLSDGFDREFQDVVEASNELAASLKPAGEGRKENRYLNVLPYEETRVLLRSAPSGDDYINASYVHGEGIQKSGHNRYICTQGPLASTTGDFWLMVFEQNVGVIVMVTKEIEGDREKSEKYWPDEVSEQFTFGDIIIELLGREKTGDIIKRKILLQHCNEKRIVYQLQYTTWPDFGVPSTTAGVRTLLRQSADLEDEVKRNGLDGPLLVHCSAGIGRTGVFIAIHSTLERLRLSPDFILDLPATVLRLRAQRSGMVQTKDQYKFVYVTLLEEIEEHLKS